MALRAKLKIEYLFLTEYSKLDYVSGVNAVTDSSDSGLLDVTHGLYIVLVQLSRVGEKETVLRCSARILYILWYTGKREQSSRTSPRIPSTTDSSPS